MAPSYANLVVGLREQKFLKEQAISVETLN
jgi:hypothetical protein